MALFSSINWQDLITGPLSCSTGCCVYFSTSTTLFWLLQLWSRVWNSDTWLALFFFLRITLAIWGRLWFTINVRIFSYFCGEYYWYFDGDYIESIAILVILILLIHEYRYFSICCVFYFFSVVLQFLLCRSFTSLVKFFPKYFIVLMLLWKGSFYFFSYILSLVNRQKNGLLLIDVVWCNFTDIID